MRDADVGVCKGDWPAAAARAGIAMAAIALSSASPQVFAQADTLTQPLPSVQAPAPLTLKLELVVTELPRFDGADGSENRLGLALLPPGRSALGVAAAISTTLSDASVADRAAPVSALDLGLQWRYTLQSNHRIDVTAWRRMTGPVDAYTLVQSRQPVYGARIGMHLKPARASGLVADYGFIGLQLEGGGRLMLRKKDGKPVIMYRLKF